MNMEPNICRICIDDTGAIPIFSNIEEDAISVKIMRCVNIDLAADDGLPDYICDNCASELSIAYRFIIKCETSDKLLRGNLDAQDPPEHSYESLVLDIKTESEVREFDDSSFNTEAAQQYPDLEDDDENETANVKMKDRISQNNKTACFGLLKCSVCEIIVNSRAAMKSHMRTHTGEKPYSCKYCGKQFSRKDNLIRHIERHTKERKPYTRMLKRNKIGPMQCVECGILMNSPSAMQIHVRTHTGEKPFACSSCDKCFTTKGCLSRHIETNHCKKRERKFTCETCGKSFYRKTEIILHIRTHTGEKPHVCPFCSRRFLQVSSLIRHKRTHTGDRPYACHICGKMFIDKTVMSKHLSVHSDERKFKCHVCDKAVKSKNSLNIHMQTHSNEKHNVCNQCGLTFSLKGNLKSHMLRKHSEKSGQCTICLKVFSNLEVHMRKHTGEKPFTCSICSRAFGTKVSLSTHMTFKHVSPDKYRCSIGDCNKSFPIASMLEFHLLKQHTNQTPHVCHHCSRGFFRVSDLSRHLKVSHMDMLLVKVKPPLD